MRLNGYVLLPSPQKSRAGIRLLYKWTRTRMTQILRWCSFPPKSSSDMFHSPHVVLGGHARFGFTEFALWAADGTEWVGDTCGPLHFREAVMCSRLDDYCYCRGKVQAANTVVLVFFAFREATCPSSQNATLGSGINPSFHPGISLCRNLHQADPTVNPSGLLPHFYCLEIIRNIIGTKHAGLKQSRQLKINYREYVR